MRILLSATNLRAANIGGGDTFICGLASALAAHSDHEVGLLVPEPAVERVSRLIGESVKLIVVRSFTGTSRILADALRLGWRAKRWGADLVVYPHEWKPPCRSTVLLVAQNILWMHPDSMPDSGPKGKLLRSLVRLTSRRADAWVAVSSETARLWAARGGPRLEDVAVLPEGIDVPAEPLVGVNAASVMPYGVLAVTGDSPHKQLAILEMAVDHARAVDPGFAIDVVGVERGPRPGRRYHGFVDRTRLLLMMAAADTVVFPSRIESFGLPAFEACSLGKRCIVAEGSAMAEWLGDRAVTFDGSPVALAEALLAGPGETPRPDTRFRWANVIGAWTDEFERVSRK